MISLRPSLITAHHSVSSLSDPAREASPCSRYLRAARDVDTTCTVRRNVHESLARTVRAHRAPKLLLGCVGRSDRSKLAQHQKLGAVPVNRLCARALANAKDQRRGAVRCMLSLRGSQLDRSTLRQKFEQLHQAWPWSGLARFGPYLAKPVMWRWPEQPPISSNGAPAERHISYRVPWRGGSPLSVLPLSTAMLLAWPSTQRLAREFTVICRSTAFFTLVAARYTCSGYGRSA
jgi:hypothetical protein